MRRILASRLPITPAHTASAIAPSPCGYRHGIDLVAGGRRPASIGDDGALRRPACPRPAVRLVAAHLPPASRHRAAVERMIVWPDLACRGRFAGVRCGAPHGVTRAPAPAIHVEHEDRRATGREESGPSSSCAAWLGRAGPTARLSSSRSRKDRSGRARDRRRGAARRHSSLAERRARLTAHWFSRHVFGPGPAQHTGWLAPIRQRGVCSTYRTQSGATAAGVAAPLRLGAGCAGRRRHLASTRRREPAPVSMACSRSAATSRDFRASRGASGSAPSARRLMPRQGRAGSRRAGRLNAPWKIDRTMRVFAPPLPPPARRVYQPGAFRNGPGPSWIVWQIASGKLVPPTLCAAAPVALKLLS